MTNTPKKSNAKAWDNKELGASEKHARKATSAREKALDNNLGLQTISIRLQKNLIDNLKSLAEEDGLGYQPFLRQILMRYVRQIHDERRNKIKKDASSRAIR